MIEVGWYLLDDFRVLERIFFLELESGFFLDLVSGFFLDFGLESVKPITGRVSSKS